jgi:exopolyphosphatase/guanosine-5'-triphosphate,3'-diphosphate pyrophosphatase
VRGACIDIGSNTTRLLVADYAGRRLTEVHQQRAFTRIGRGLAASGAIGDAKIAEVVAVVAGQITAAHEHGAGTIRAVATAAIRRATNGAALVEAIAGHTGLTVEILSGEEEARLAFLGAAATLPRAPAGPLGVIDVGGGSTELIIGVGPSVEFSVSMQAGVVRQTERHLHHDPPTCPELAALGAEVAATIERSVPDGLRRAARHAIAVAGTATSSAAIDQALEPYDPARVQGYRVELTTLRLLLARLASLPLAERRQVKGLDPDRAPTIIAGVIILIRVLEAFGLDAFEASEHDILWGVALATVAAAV